MAVTMPSKFSFRLFAGLVLLFVAYGGYRVCLFLSTMRKYREATKSQWVAAPQNFLQLRHGETPPLKFFRINDEVMGGKSTSSVEVVAHKYLLFSGTINTNGGGFASTRTLGDEQPLGLKKNSFLLLDAAGDGQLHKIVLYTADSWSMSVPSWSHDFTPTKRATHRLALSDFTPSSQGSVVKGAKLDATKVTGIGFGLSLYTQYGKPNPNFGDGPFWLEVHGVKEAESRAKKVESRLRSIMANKTVRIPLGRFYFLEAGA